MIVPVELVLPVIPLTAGMFDTQVLKHVMLAGPIVSFVLLLLIGFSVVSLGHHFPQVPALQGNRAEPGRIRPRLRRREKPVRALRAGRKGEKSPLTEVFRAGYLEPDRIQRERGEAARGEAAQGGRTAPFPVENVHRAMYKTTHEQVGGMEDLLPFSPPPAAPRRSSACSAPCGGS